MAPSEIVAKAVASGLGGIALTDHQSSKNCPAIAKCAKDAGLKCLFGLEVQTSEEVHTLALFDTLEQAEAMTEWVYAALPKRVNDPETFGDQPIVTWDNDIIDMEWRILAMGCRNSIPETSEKTHSLGGLYLAAHIDRPNFSVFNSLGGIPEGVFDAVEISRTCDENIWLPKASDYAVVRSSDAHNLDDIAKVWTELPTDKLDIKTLKEIFASKSTIISDRLRNF